MTPLRLEAPAKLNLSLRVLGRRPDGYHMLDSELVLLELADRLLLLPGCSGLRIEGVRDGQVPLGPDNLAWRGLTAALGGEPDLACLALEKRVPIASGLGGGSSDAAAAWRLGRAWGGSPERASSAEIAGLTRIGADVPFFAAAVAAARVRGVGEVVEPLPAREAHVVLVHPPFGLSTAAVFAELRADEWGSAGNDLMGPARRLRPELDEMMDLVRRAGADPGLSGSGPTLFVLEDDAERAAALADGLQRDRMRVTLTRTRTTAATIEAIDDEED